MKQEAILLQISTNNMEKFTGTKVVHQKDHHYGWTCLNGGEK